MIIPAGPADVRVHFENPTDPRRREPTYPEVRKAKSEKGTQLIVSEMSCVPFVLCLL